MKYKHALFLNPYIESSATAVMGLFPPTGLEYVATSAKGHVEKLTLLDLRYEKDLSKPDNLIDFIKRNMDIVCVGVGWDRQFEEVLKLLNMMPDGMPLIVGGYKATEQVEEIFKSCPKVDIIVRGEGEETIKEVMDGMPLKDIQGISYRDGDKVIHNKNRELPDVNKLLPPDRSLRNNEYRMMLNGTSVSNVSFDTVLSTRGCPFTCKFCTFSLNPLGQKRGYSPRAVDSVVDEIASIKANMILFSDDNFCIDAKRAEAICDEIIRRKIKKRFAAQARIDISRHEELLKKMVRAGFKILLLGIESPHNYILEQFNKGFDQETIRKSFKILNKYPIYYHGYFIYGNIGETEEEMLYIPKFAKEIGVDSITFHKLRMERFSTLREVAEKNPKYHITSRGEVYSDMYSHARLKKIGRKIKFTFYTPVTLLKIAKKFLIVGIFNFSDILSFVAASPFLVKNVIARDIQKNRFGDSLKRIFIKNA